MSSYNETSRLPQDEDERIIEEVRRRKADKKKAIGYDEPYERAQSEGYGGGGSRSSQKYEYESPRGRRKDKSPIAMRYRSRSPSPVSRNLRGRSRSPPPRATAPIEVMHEREGEYRYDEFSGRRHFDVGYQVALPTGGPIAESPSISSVSSSPSTESMSPSPTMPKESTRHRLMHPLEPKHKKLSKKHPLGTRTVDLDTRVARVGKHGENVHFISFGKLQVRLIRGKHLPKNGIMSVHFYLPTPSVKAHAHPFGVSREVKRVENYTWDETFTTKVELETKENALEITRNLVVHLRYASPHLHRNLGDMEGTVDVSEMIRSSSPLHAAQVKLPLYPAGEHKKKRERAVDDKYRPKLYLEVLWRPSDAFRHSFASLEEDHRHDMKGIKTKNWRLNVAGFAPYGTSYGLIWLQNVAQSWIGSMGDVIDVLNVTSSVQPGPFSARGRSDVWEAVVTVWYRIDESKLRAHAKREIEVLENRERELEERTMRRKHGTQQPLPVSGSGGRTQVPTRVSGSQQSQRGSGSYGSEQLQGGSSGQAGSVGDRSLGRPGQQQQPGQQQSRRDEDIEYSADQPSSSGNNNLVEMKTLNTALISRPALATDGRLIG